MNDAVVPFWTLSNGSSALEVPDDFYGTSDEGLTAERLTRLRRVLAAWSEEAPLILERHPIRGEDVRRGGQPVASASPIMKALGEIVGGGRTATQTEQAAGTSEVLYRLVVPREIAERLGAGSAHMMKAADGSGAIRGSVVAGNKIITGAKFMPTAAAGTASTTTGGAGAAAAGGALIAAGPLLVLLTATAMSVYAEEQRRRALERLHESLDEVKKELLEKERDQLHGATRAINAATALLADEGRLGKTLGIDSAVYAIDTALATAERRIDEWERHLNRLSDGATPEALEKAFPGIDPDEEGDFIAKVRMAVFAITMKRRVAVLQAAEHTQLNPDLTLGRFVSKLVGDVRAVDDLEQRLTGLLEQLASLPLKPPNKVHEVMFGRGEVRRLLEWSPRLQRLAQQERPQTTTPGDVELALVVSSDGSARVLSPLTLLG